MADIPAEFEPHFRKSPVTAPWEPLYSRRRADGVDLAFEVIPARCNSRGLLHGGVLAALCDNVMGLSLATMLRGEANVVTISLALDYLDSARIGDLMTIVPRVVRAGGSLARRIRSITTTTSPRIRSVRVSGGNLVDRQISTETD